MNRAGEHRCYDCPEGGDCSQKGTNEQNMKVQPGWWRSVEEVNGSIVKGDRFYRCLVIEQCEGGINATCAAFRGDLLCSRCVEGYVAVTLTSPCEKCPDTAVSWALTIGIVIVLLVMVVIMYWGVLKTNADLQRIAKSTQRAESRRNLLALEKQEGQRLAAQEMLGGEKLEWDIENTQTTGSKKAEGIEETGPPVDPLDLSAGLVAGGIMGLTPSRNDFNKSQSFIGAQGDGEYFKSEAEEEYFEIKQMFGDQEHIKKVKLTSRSTPNFTYKMKIVLGFFQIVTNLSSSLNVAWPVAYAEFLSWFDFLNLDFVPWQSLECTTAIDFFTKLTLAAVTPLLAVAMLFLFWYLPQNFFAKRKYTHGEAGMAIPESSHSSIAYIHKMQRVRRQMGRLVFFTIFLIYPKVSSTIFAYFQCTDIGGTEYLLADLRIECGPNTYWSNWMPLAAVQYGKGGG